MFENFPRRNSTNQPKDVSIIAQIFEKGNIT